MDEAGPDAPERDGDGPTAEEDDEDVFRWGAVEEAENEFRGGREVLAAHDDIDGEPVFVVADVSREEAWVAVDDDEVLDLIDWQ